MNTNYCRACLAELEAGQIKQREVQQARAKGLCTKHYKRKLREEAGVVPRATDLGKVESITIRLPVATMKVLRSDARRENCSVADLIRKAVGAAAVVLVLLSSLQANAGESLTPATHEQLEAAVASLHPVGPQCRWECGKVEFVKFCHGVQYPADAKTTCGARAELLAVCVRGGEVCSP